MTAGLSMRVVVDANIVAAALVQPHGWTARELSRKDVDWFAPQFLRDELEENAAKLAGFAGCSREAFVRRLKDLDQVRFVPPEELAAAEEHPLVRQAVLVDPDDATYLKAFVAAKADCLWTRDRALLGAFPDLAVLVLPPRDDQA